MDRRVATTWEEKERQRIEATRVKHEELRLRFLNPRIRLRGRDLEALDRQVAEKQAARERDIQEEREYAASVHATERAIVEMESKENDEMRNQKGELLEEWKREAARRAEEKIAELEEYHRKEKYIGPSSAQQFDGEDTLMEKRRALQAAQLRSWVKEQTAMREQRLLDEKKQSLDFDSHVENYSRECDKLDAEQKARKAREDRDIQRYNQLEAMRRAQEKEKQHQLENEQSKLEEPLLLTQRNSLSQSALPGRYRPDHFAGLKREQLEKIRQEQLEQMREQELIRAKEAADELAYARKQQDIITAADQAAYDEQEARRKKNLETQAYQLEQAQRRKREGEQVPKQGEISKEFFDWFGKSHR
mmetsp:Transcript_20962/g.38987  ORF Transcript_20962/g.38987 Transcript_20962/m.38987 type:complete len:362 (+) Transcript_20962:239-1324(+)